MAFSAPKTCLTYVLGIQKNRLNEMAFWAPKTLFNVCFGYSKEPYQWDGFLSTKNLFNVCFRYSKEPSQWDGFLSTQNLFNVCFGYSKEPSQWDGFLSTQNLFNLKDKNLFKILVSKLFLIWIEDSLNIFPARDDLVICWLAFRKVWPRQNVSPDLDPNHLHSNKCLLKNIFGLIWFFTSQSTILEMSGWVFLGWSSTKQELMCLAQKHKTEPSVRLKHRNPSIMSQVLYH